MILLLVVDHRIPFDKDVPGATAVQRLPGGQPCVTEADSSYDEYGGPPEAEIAWLKHGKVERPPVDFGHEQMAK